MRKILVTALLTILVGCNSSEKDSLKVVVPNETLIVSSKGKLFNFNLETKKLTWQYVSKEDTLGNRNRFTYDTEKIYMPFESGRLIGVNINSGKVIWDHNFINPSYRATDNAGNTDPDKDYSDRYLGPIFMSRPLVSGNRVYIASAGRPETFKSDFFVVDAKNGNVIRTNPNSTNYNYFQPVENKGNMYVNSAVFLDLHYQSGSDRNGINENASFDHTLYVQMQTSGNRLLFGDNEGRFYACEVNKDGFVKAGNNSDPGSNYAKNDQFFEWTYQSEKYPALGDDQTALLGNLLIVCKQSENESKTALIAIDSKSGKEKWIFERTGLIKTWHPANQNEITGYTKDKIFVVDSKGAINFEAPIDPSLYPVSNIEINSKKQLLYISGKGIVSLDRKTKQATLLIAHTFYPSSIPLNQIKYFEK
ncbi:PQQ-binding-like beta-propeller repeat protein [Chryseobacterium sp. SSA4.19]|uniref:outer membrane protein assembly factor BamB family protein n=1 Tax=Chryseobacterium sp. SSA4.19 TaxID=2919915 RepID=UPI001F4DFF36|nr:PQQ-binding-like beta-propeller repeat protein [Chryseobacterium sp. SSA4.19]MCJ8153274.1 PQQ-binding-like beta-propeller repeat protein [Chryseobacterium sp. SSA4.19]